MCGIVAVVSRPSTRPVPADDEVLALLDRALGGLDAGSTATADVAGAARLVAAADRLLRGVPGVRALLGRHDLASAIGVRLDRIAARLDECEASLEAAAGLDAETLETASADLLAARDAVWAVRVDRLGTAASVAELAGLDAEVAAVSGYLSIQQALAAIDRMEVRGRDSAGFHVFVGGHALDLGDPMVATAVARRSADPLFQSGSVRVADGVIGFVYKAAAEIGELGDNVRAIRSEILADDLLRRALSSPTARLSVIGHTRWASVGIISEPNCHPVNGEQLERRGGEASTCTVAVLNGDVDNHADLKVLHGLRIAGPITTDAKVIPALMSTHAASGASMAEAFRRTVAEFEGSVAIAAQSADDIDAVYLALRGSGQGLYVGIADDRFVVASEPYGLVEETDRFVRLDGETPSGTGSRGQVVVLDAGSAGDLAGIHRLGYDGAPI
ncbi:MAG: glucosamine-6-phosphate synthase, partial [Ilumatobacteraceae bacterium]